MRAFTVSFHSPTATCFGPAKLLISTISACYCMLFTRFGGMSLAVFNSLYVCGRVRRVCLDIDFVFLDLVWFVFFYQAITCALSVVFSPEVAVVGVGSPNSPFLITFPFPVPFRITPHFLSGSFLGQFTLLYVLGYPPTSLGVSVTLIRFTPFILLSCECPSSHSLRSDVSPLIPFPIFGKCTRVHAGC